MIYSSLLLNIFIVLLVFLSVPEELVSSEMKTEEEVIADCVGIYLHILEKKCKISMENILKINFSISEIYLH